MKAGNSSKDREKMRDIGKSVIDVANDNSYIVSKGTKALVILPADDSM